MCGIFGYYNFHVGRTRKEILDCLLTALKRLEYRGYDSAGVALDLEPCPQNGFANGVSVCAAGPPLVIKSSGKIAELERLAYSELSQQSLDLGAVFETHTGIAHTRWATHGSPTATNAHPQSSDSQHEFLVVHNGIITNYKALKDFLISHGEVFVSETDTEVIPKLCKYVFNSLTEAVSLSQLVLEVMGHLEGAYALLVKSRHYPGELVACKRGSPLILGLRFADADSDNSSPRGLSGVGDLSPRGLSGLGDLAAAELLDSPCNGGNRRNGCEALECFLASDASAVVEHTKKVIVLEDNDLVHLGAGQYQVFNAGPTRPKSAAAAGEGKGARPPTAVSRALQTLEMEGGYDHYMAKEIHEQPESIFQTMRGRIRLHRSNGASDPYAAEQRVKLGGLAEYLESIRSGRRIMFVACGTSFHACLAARQTVEDLVGIPVALELASDLLDRRCPIFRDDCCVFVSQSGETADTLQALEYAKSKGALCVGITNTVGSAIARSTHCGVHINAGCEIGVASTKAYTSQIVVITLMALALSEDSIARRQLRDEIIDSMALLPDKIRQTLKLDGYMRQLAEKLKEEQSLLVFGRGYNFATALEAALKVKEVALMHSEGILAGEMKHGPLALVDDRMPILVIATQDKMHAKMLSVIQQLRARGAYLIVVCNEGDTDVEEICQGHASLVKVPLVVDCLQPIINIVPLQLLSYHLTVLRGFDVDQPRNLAKSVTVSEEQGELPKRGGQLGVAR
ncbi:hypothetical protein N2152v2_010525 [Parachlorella kessleri]